MRILLLGPVRMRTGGRETSVGRPQLRLLLAVLALEVNRVVPVDRLVDLLWPASPPRTAVHAIHASVSRLRGVLAGPGDPQVGVTRHGAGYLLHADPEIIDAHRFATLVEQARREDDVRRVSLLDEALGLWSGPAVSATAATDETRHLLCHGLEEARLTASEDRIDAQMRLGDHRDVLSDLAALVAASPLRERLVGQQMRALYRCGRPGEALEAYRLLCKRLADELGLDPGEELRHLEVAILRGDPALEPVPGSAPAVAAGPAGAVPAQLPPAVSGFAGRAAELDRLDRLLAGHQAERAATLIAAIHGTAGVGKTALAVHWAHRVPEWFPDGQLYVDLRGFDPTGGAVEAGDALHGFLTALGVPAERIPSGVEQRTGLYRSLLTGKRVLVVLDNATNAEQVRPSLPGSPGCMALVTSRYQLAPLLVDEGAFSLTLDLVSAAEARQLLTRRLGPERMAADAEAADDVIALTARLPLALAIVAARAATRPDFPLSALAAELRQSPGGLDAFDVVEPSVGLRAAFSWSYRGLRTAEADLFRLLGLHPGPDVTAPAAASLAGLPVSQVRPILLELTRAHLLTEHLPGRYAQHDLLRAYATELATEHHDAGWRCAATHRMLDHYVHTAREADRLLSGRAQTAVPAEPATGVIPEPLTGRDEALAWFHAERPTLTAAIRRAAQTRCEFHAVQLAAATATFLRRQARWPELRDTQLTALRAARRIGDPTTQAEAHRAAGAAETQLGRPDTACTHLRSALDLFEAAGDRVGQARTHTAIAVLRSRQEHHREALDHAEHALDLFRAAGHLAGTAMALNNIGWDHLQLGDHDRAIAYCAQARAAFRDLADRYGEAYSCHSLADAYCRAGRYADAVASYRAAIDTYRVTGDRHLAVPALTALGRTHQIAGDLASARHALRQALTLARNIAHPDAETLPALLDELDRQPHRNGAEERTASS